MPCYTMRSDNQNQKANSGKEKIPASSKKALASLKSATRKSSVPAQPIAGYANRFRNNSLTYIKMNSNCPVW